MPWMPWTYRQCLAWAKVISAFGGMSAGGLFQTGKTLRSLKPLVRGFIGGI